MTHDFVFVFNSVLLGVGLAMDAFSVSLANGMNDTKMGRSCMMKIALVFSVFQAAMPMLGWVLVHTLVEYFKAFEKFIPWIALILLCYIGIKMIRDGRCECAETESDDDCCSSLTFSALVIQGIATSIDALSVGFTISEYGLVMALIAALIIAVVTFFICYGGVVIGKKFGNALSGKANIFGGCILIFIGIEIFLKGIL